MLMALHTHTVIHPLRGSPCKAFRNLEGMSDRKLSHGLQAKCCADNIGLFQESHSVAEKEVKVRRSRWESKLPSRALKLPYN